MIYGPGFGAIYARSWTHFAGDAGPGILRLLRDAGIRRGRVIDLGCGPGTLAARLVRAGYRVRGVDQSEALLSIARRAVPRATFVRGNLRTARLPAADAVVSTFDTLNYLRAAELRALFRRVATALRAGGLLVFDLVTPDDLDRHPSPSTFAKSDDRTVAILRVHRLPRRSEKRYEITTFTRDRREWRRADETHVQHMHRTAAVARWLRAAGFRATILGGYDGSREISGRAVFIAVRL